MDRRVVLLSGMALASALLGLTGASTQAQQDQDVRLQEFTIDPPSLTVATGQTVRFNVSNQGTVEHSLEAELESAGIEQVLFPDNLQPGQSDMEEVTFSQPGTWELYCPLADHRDRGMLATVQVQDAAEAPAPQPQDQAPPATATTMPSSKPAPPVVTAPPVPPAPARRGY